VRHSPTKEPSSLITPLKLASIEPDGSSQSAHDDDPATQ